MQAHAEDLRAEVQDRDDAEALVAAVCKDHHTAPITDAERAMLDYAIKLTRSPQSMEASDVEALRAHGFDDRQISQIVQVTALFNYYNRIADGLGIEGEAHW